MKKILSSVALVFFVLLGLSTSVWAHTDVSVAQALDMVNTNDQLIVVDVRELSEYCGTLGHIPGALNYPWSSGVLEDTYGELPLEGEILVVCHSGGRSNSASNFLDSQGFTNIYDMNGGMSSWTGQTVGCIDSDGDGVNDDLDNCPGVDNPDQEDGDSDGVGTICDNCPGDSNPNQGDGDNDQVGNFCDNCPEDSNPNQVDMDCDGIGDACDLFTDCTDGIDCDNDCDGVYNQDDICMSIPDPGQEDTLPPGGNGCGDACECEGNFDGDQDCDGSDATVFKTDFGRNLFSNPCTTLDICNGNFDCDEDVDGSDATVFKTDFGRSQFSNPCPGCGDGPWCP